MLHCVAALAEWPALLTASGDVQGAAAVQAWAHHGVPGGGQPVSLLAQLLPPPHVEGGDVAWGAGAGSQLQAGGCGAVVWAPAGTPDADPVCAAPKDAGPGHHPEAGALQGRGAAPHLPLWTAPPQPGHCSLP